MSSISDYEGGNQAERRERAQFTLYYSGQQEKHPLKAFGWLLGPPGTYPQPDPHQLPTTELTNDSENVMKAVTFMGMKDHDLQLFDELQQRKKEIDK